MLLLQFYLQHKQSSAKEFSDIRAQSESDLTVVTPFSIIHRVLLESELLQIGVGLGQQTDEEEPRAGAVERRHRLRRGRNFVTWRIDYYHRQADNVYPYGL